MKITYYGHSCCGIEVAGKHLLIDPFISPNPLARDIEVNRIPADYVLISHAHQDHLADAVNIANRAGAKVVSNYEICNWFGNQGIENAHPMNHGGRVKFDFGSVKYVNAIHSSSFPDGAYGGNPGGFVIESSEGNVYFSGDTALTYDMKLIGETTELKLAILCIGDNFTMGVQEAIKASDFVRCNRVLGVHYDTFPPIQIDHADAKAKFHAAGKELVLLPVGERIEV